MKSNTNEIVYKENLSQWVLLMKVNAPLIAEESKPGQFVILALDNEFSERFPLTIADSDKEEGNITIIFQIAGKSTFELSKLKEGDKILNLVGPLGNPTHIEKYGKVVCVGGGVGGAPLYPILRAFKKAGNEIITVLGAKSSDLLVLKDKMEEKSDRFIPCTDDGSYGRKALVTEPLKELCEEEDKPDLVVAIGPPIMMKLCSETTKKYNIPTMVSLNTIMVDGTGMCGGCRVNVGGEVKFVCVDGPEFDGHLVDFDNMIKRINSYKKQEESAFEEECKLNSQIGEAEKNGRKSKE